MLAIILAYTYKFLWPTVDRVCNLFLHQLCVNKCQKACKHIFFKTNVLFSFLIRELFLKTNAQLTIRCRQLLSELSYIYPIDLVSLKFSEKKMFKDYFCLNFLSMKKLIAVGLIKCSAMIHSRANICFKSRFRLFWY